MLRISVFDIIDRYSAVFILAIKKIVEVQAFNNLTSIALKAYFFLVMEVVGWRDGAG